MQSGPGLSSQAAKQGLGGSVRGLAVSDLQIAAFGPRRHGELQLQHGLVHNEREREG